MFAPGVGFGTGGVTLVLTDSVLRASGNGGAAVEAGPGTTVNLRHSGFQPTWAMSWCASKVCLSWPPPR